MVLLVIAPMTKIALSMTFRSKSVIWRLKGIPFVKIWQISMRSSMSSRFLSPNPPKISFLIKQFENVWWDFVNEKRMGTSVFTNTLGIVWYYRSNYIFGVVIQNLSSASLFWSNLGSGPSRCRKTCTRPGRLEAQSALPWSNSLWMLDWTRISGLIQGCPNIYLNPLVVFYHMFFW